MLHSLFNPRYKSTNISLLAIGETSFRQVAVLSTVKKSVKYVEMFHPQNSLVVIRNWWAILLIKI
jgi:hypothetical protein